ncbi:response regulator [Tropicibacter naphthalenivorans]|uniref:KDP operon transcriptional regulatory protein KdpE n=1 Tax=Tropicibacter naphthalenivorans TaxID=441103 RepID=A0A0P1FZC6_9RHOB|nr:response regulator [Tropicibacter naphthalenivorans]CUH74702.1 KDP operon transcriptional regulatory protein KdpE [Tropicibacter naphthalenivorans]SMC49687.1 Response regulator receiver domain-containing protein [Tropicibacter naphthalenivorans]
MDDTKPLAAHLRPTAARPLLGLTILVVEDSRFSCDAMRLLCLRSGARIRRADCLKSARRHLRVYRPSVVIIDLGLPDGSGAELISELTVACPRVDVVLGTSGDSFSEDVALAAGADGFLAKPITSVATFQNAILSALPVERQPSGPRLVNDDPVTPDPVAYRDDMAHAADVLDDKESDRALSYVTQFLTGVARSAGDGVLQKAAEDLAETRRMGRPVQSHLARLAALVQDRLADRVAM